MIYPGLNPLKKLRNQWNQITTSSPHLPKLEPLGFSPASSFIPSITTQNTLPSVYSLLPNLVLLDLGETLGSVQLDFKIVLLYLMWPSKRNTSHF